MRRERLIALAGAGLLATGLAGADEPAYRFRAPITVRQPAAFVQLPLPAGAYGRSQGADLRDLRIVDANGERVPFALLEPRAPEALRTEDQRPAVLYPLKSKPGANAPWTAPVDVVVQGDRISVRSRVAAAPAKGTKQPVGWLLDLTERQPGDPRPQSLEFQWSGPAEFTATYYFETSDDLRAWRAGGAGQLLALSSATGPLTQAAIMLPGNVGRFVRLFWGDAASAPLVTGARVRAIRQTSIVLDKATEIVIPPGAAPQDKGVTDPLAARALHFDLGGALPVEQLDLRLPPGTRVAPVRVQGRDRRDLPWRDIGASVFYRLERGAEVNVSSPLAVHARLRYLRVLPDERAAALDPAMTQLIVQTRLASLVFASQGAAPYALLAGAEKAAASALPVASLMADLEAERAHFGTATLGEWSEVAAVARAAEQAQKLAGLRPWVLWSLLLAGLGGLATMVWRLARAGGATGAEPGG